jgi:uncharacterized membrane protein YhaH (DUF805 family)
MKLIQPNFSWQQFLFSWHGRVPRRQYWALYMLCLCGSFTLISYFIDRHLGMLEVEFPPASTAASLVLFWPGSVILIKRLHDINLSTWQYFKPLLITLAIAAFGMGLMIIKKDMLQQDGPIKMAFIAGTTVLAAPFFIYWFWLGLLVSFKRGTDGDNRFGRDIRAQIIDQTTDTSTKTESDTTA